MAADFNSTLMRAGIGADRLFEVAVQAFFRIQLRAVTGQAEQLDFVLALSRPGFDGFAVIGSQLIQNQQLFSLGVNDHPACFSLDHSPSGYTDSCLTMGDKSLHFHLN